MRIAIAAASLVAASVAWSADFTYIDRTEMTGGSMKRLMGIASKFGGKSGPQQTMHRFSGPKMSTESGNVRSIFDLAAETVTAVDLDKKEYSVITFAEMAEAMKAAMARVNEAHSKSKNDGQDIQMKWKVSVDRTGKTANIVGVATEQAIMSLEMEASQANAPQGPMAMTSMKIDSWHGKPAGWEAAQKTLASLAGKMSAISGPFAAFANTSPGAMEGLQEAAREMAKLGGIPMRSITRLGGASMGGGADGSSAPPASAKKEEPKDAKDAVLGRLGGFGRFGKRKPKDEPKKEDSAAPPTQPSPAGSSEGVLMEMTTEVISYSSNAIDPLEMTVPAGFKQVEHPMKKMLEKNKR